MNSQVEFRLKVLLNSHTLRVVSIESLSNSKSVLSFNSQFCDTKKAQLFCSNILQVTKFPLLNVPLSKDSKIHKVCFCEVAIGDSLYVSDEYAQGLDVPKNYSSFLVSDGPEITEFYNFSNTDISSLMYVIKDQKKILPLYEIVFEYDEELERLSRDSFVCHKCKNNESIMFCPSERASFCSSCDEDIHRDEFLRRHERLYFSKVGQKKFICCSKHNTKVVQYFCTQCIEPLCTECKMAGSHSTVDTSDHKIIPFLDACQSFKVKLSECTMPFHRMIGTYETEISQFNSNVNTFKDNISSVRAHIEREFKALTLQLNSIENQQKQILNAKFADRLVKIENLKKVDEFSKSLDPADLLSNFKSIRDISQNDTDFVFDRFVPIKVQCQGSITLKLPKEMDSAVSFADTSDKSVRWRIETMHMAKDNETH